MWEKRHSQLSQFVCYKVKERISKRMLQENKARQIFRKRTFLILLPTNYQRGPFCENSSWKPFTYWFHKKNSILDNWLGSAYASGVVKLIHWLGINLMCFYIKPTKDWLAKELCKVESYFTLNSQFPLIKKPVTSLAL